MAKRALIPPRSIEPQHSQLGISHQLREIWKKMTHKSVIRPMLEDGVGEHRRVEKHGRRGDGPTQGSTMFSTLAPGMTQNHN